MCPRRYLLPPIIFYAGLSVKKKHFFRNFPTISAFGILGTYVAFAVIALSLYVIAQLPNSLNLSVSPLCISLEVIAPQPACRIPMEAKNAMYIHRCPSTSCRGIFEIAAILR